MDALSQLGSFIQLNDLLLSQTQLSTFKLLLNLARLSYKVEQKGKNVLRILSDFAKL